MGPIRPPRACGGALHTYGKKYDFVKLYVAVDYRLACSGLCNCYLYCQCWLLFVIELLNLRPAVKKAIILLL